MNTDLIATTMHRYDYCEYLLALKPNESVFEKIKKIREGFSKKYKSGALDSYPYITLVRFFQFKTMESRLIKNVTNIAMQQQPFMVSLKDFKSFPSHTIFINVESKQQLANLVKQLKVARHIMTLNQENKPYFITDPYLLIARKLLPWQYEKGWNEYIRRHFSSHFMADSMLLVKRSVSVDGEGPIRSGKFQTAGQFKFMNLPVAAQQGDLFG